MIPITLGSSVLPRPLARSCRSILKYRQGLHVEQFLPYKSSLQPIGSHPARGMAGSGSPIVQYSSLLPPVGVWSVSQYQCGGSPFRAPIYRCLGMPLPHLLANRTHTHLLLPKFNYLLMPPIILWGINPISLGHPCKR